MWNAAKQFDKGKFTVLYAKNKKVKKKFKKNFFSI
jgi:hypothetical protein